MKVFFINLLLKLQRWIWLPISHFYLFTIPYWLLILKYGSKDKVPQEELGKLLSHIDLSSLGLTMNLTSTLDRVGKLTGRDIWDFKFSQILSTWMRAEADYDTIMYIEGIRRADNPRQATVDAMVKLGDLTPAMLDYYFNTEAGDEFKEWIRVGFAKRSEENKE